MSKEASIYELEGKPSLKVAIPLGLQHVLAMFTGNIAPIIILAGVINIAEADRVLMIQSAMIVAGLVTLVQLYPIWKVGSGLPLVMGTSFAFVPTVLAVGQKYGLAGVLGGSLGGTLVEVLLGFFIKPLRKFFPPIVTGTVLIAIGLSLIPTGIKYFAGGEGAKDFGSPQNLILGLIVLLTVILLQRFGKGVFSIAAILIALVLGYIIAIPMGKVDFTGVSQAGWFSLPRPLKFGLEFHLDAILKFAAVYLIAGLETIGNISAIASSGLDREATDDEMTGAVLANGFGSAFASIFGVLPNIGFGQNAGIVAMTKVVNRFCVATGAAFLVFAGIVPKFGAICAAMPPSVLGGAVTMIFASITVSGIKMVSSKGIDSRISTILSVSLGVGIGFSQVPAALEFMPAFFKGFFGDPVVAAGILALILNIVFPEKAEKKSDEKNNLATE
ncbi:putative purine permease [Gottschalkia purinilytica]|uniref:Putative purine permease n=1 Tax=Gottschalkia purinilytica TaxID=1503 RepID=A0A0L0W952_GOTPU|nr:nucleobase:cation symporter-2 family protein [Gottschalkia purinilytica]KNF08074.1 putative purine permease [Gottschalkia purinilytica]